MAASARPLDPDVGLFRVGKASLIWGLVFALGPANKAGLVQLLGIDLKGGMELAMGAAMFTRYAQTADAAVVLLGRQRPRIAGPGLPGWPVRTPA